MRLCVSVCSAKDYLFGGRLSVYERIHKYIYVLFIYVCVVLILGITPKDKPAIRTSVLLILRNAKCASCRRDGLYWNWKLNREKQWEWFFSLLYHHKTRDMTFHIFIYPHWYTLCSSELPLTDLVRRNFNHCWMQRLVWRKHLNGRNTHPPLFQFYGWKIFDYKDKLTTRFRILYTHVSWC